MSPVTIEQAFALALQHHQGGRLAEAEQIYRQILAAEPRHADALHLLGVIAHQGGRHDVAVEHIRQAVALAPGDSAYHSNLGAAYSAMGRPEDAIAACRRAIALKPDFADAHCNLGVALRDAGQLDAAISAYCQAVALAPGNSAYHSNLGAAYWAMGRTEDAIAACRRAIALKPDFAEAYCNLGVVLREAGQLDAAIGAYCQAVALAPGNSAYHSNLGAAYSAMGRTEDAIAACRRAIALKPDFADAHCNLGVALREAGQLDAAITAYRQALALKAGYVEAYNNLGVALRDKGRPDEAIAAYRQALALKADHPEVHSNLGVALKDTGRLDEAIAAYREAINLKPGSATALNNLGNALRDKGRLDEAVTVLHLAIASRPDFAEAHSNLGNALRDKGELDASVASFRQAISLKPDFAEAHSNLIFVMNYHPGFDTHAIAGELSRWNRRHAEPLRQEIYPHLNDRSPDRRLRIGYVSPDFSRHVICHFLTPLLEAHNGNEFEIHCYASVPRPDWITERLKRAAHVWHDVLGVPDEALARRIREDRIDILVDLSQHTANNRLLLFARKPAPVQAGWLGYPGSTGMSAVDCRLTDSFMEPEGTAWAESGETPVRLPDSWWCFDPIDEYPEPGGLPALKAGHVTFGSLNNFCKINDGVLKLWAEVLCAVEGSRLILQCPEGATQARAREWLESHGIASHRFELIAKTATREAFLQLFERMDLALETFPFNGGTTTCEALWMGIPVPTFPGTTALSRLGLSVLSAVGLPELIATSEADYVRLVTSLATDLPRLAVYRSTLRERMKSSVFMDAPRFARNVEHIYREMWRAWCRRQG